MISTVHFNTELWVLSALEAKPYLSGNEHLCQHK